MPQRTTKAIIVDQDGVYKVRTRKNSDGTKRKSSTRIDERPRARSPPFNADKVIVDETDHRRRVYRTTSRPQATRQRSYSEPRPAPRQIQEQPSRRRREREPEPVFVDRAPSPPPRTKRDSVAQYSKPSLPPSRRRRESSPAPRRPSPDRAALKTRRPRRQSEALPIRAAGAPPPPPPYQPPGYAQPGQPYGAQPYYGQGVMEPQRQGGFARRFAGKLGNAAIFGVGFTGGADLVNAII